MKQVIRIETFETNSSSYHSISIRRKSDAEKEVLEEIEFGKVTTLTGKIKYKTIGYTESYCFTSRTKLDKANMLCRYISARMDDLIYDLPEYDELSNIKDDKERKEARRQLGLNQPLFTALVKAIKNYNEINELSILDTTNFEFWQYQYNEQTHLLWLYNENHIRKLLKYYDLKIQHCKRIHSLSSLINRIGISEAKSAQYSKYDNFFQFVSYPIAHNVILVGTKVPSATK